MESNIDKLQEAKERAEETAEWAQYWAKETAEWAQYWAKETKQAQEAYELAKKEVDNG